MTSVCPSDTLWSAETWKCVQPTADSVRTSMWMHVDSVVDPWGEVGEVPKDHGYEKGRPT
jgi:hypothetical protein